jgi:hypothetical protein
VATVGGDSSALQGDYAKGNYAVRAGGKYTNDNGSTNGWGNTLYRGAFSFYPSQPTRMRDITDGTSNTVFLSEIIGQEGSGDCRGAWGRVGCNTFSPHTRNPNDAFIVTPNRWVNGQKEIYDCPPYCGLETTGKQDACYDCSGPGAGGVGARSFHPGGVNVGLGDGSTRFVAETIDGILWRNVTTIQAGDSNAGFAN